MMVRDAPPTWSAGVSGTQNWRQPDSCIAIARNSSHGKTAGTSCSISGLPQPCPMSATAGPWVPHAAGPRATSWTIGCHSAADGLAPGAASVAPLAVLLVDDSVYDGQNADAADGSHATTASATSL